MRFQDFLTDLLAGARHAVDQAHPAIDPRLAISRVNWALAEIRAKTLMTEAIAQALATTEHALTVLLGYLNSVPGLLMGVADEKALVLEAIDHLAVVLRDAGPMPEATFLLGD